MGLGLFIARKIVTAHGGTIDVTAAAAHGTACKVCIPKVPPPANTTDHLTPPALGRHTLCQLGRMTETESRHQTRAGDLEDDTAWQQQQLPRGPTQGLLAVVQRNLAVRAARLGAAVVDPKDTGGSLTGWGRSAAPKTIVVIDDELDNVDLNVMVLQSAGHTAHGATDGRAGLQSAIEHAADIVVLDYVMPGMIGAEVGKALRDHPDTRDVKILMYSGTPEATISASFAHYNAYLAKPAQGLQLLQAIEAL